MAIILGNLLGRGSFWSRMGRMDKDAIGAGYNNLGVNWTAKGTDIDSFTNITF